MQFEEIPQLRHIKIPNRVKFDDRDKNSTLYIHHSSGIQFPNGMRINPVSILHKATYICHAKYSDTLFDYEEDIKDLLNNIDDVNYVSDAVERLFDKPAYERKILQIDLSTVTIEQAQRIIDNNIMLFNKLSAMMAEQDLLSKIEQM